MLFSISVWLVTSAIFCQKMWLQYSNYPGGANAYFLANISVWYMDWGTTAVILLQLMTDALMVGHGAGYHNVFSYGSFQIHRCRIIWNSYRVIILPIFFWLSTLGERLSIHPTSRSCDRHISCSPSLGNICRLDQQCTRGQLLRWSRFPTRSGILQCLRVPERVVDVHDLLPCGATRTEGPGTART